MLSSSSDHVPALRRSLSLIQQSIEDFQTQRKKLLRASNTSRADNEVYFFAQILETVDNSLQNLGANEYVLGLRDTLASLFQAEKQELLRVSELPDSSKEIDLFSSILQAVENGLHQLDESYEELSKKLEESLQSKAGEAIAEAEENRKGWLKRRKKKK